MNRTDLESKIKPTVTIYLSWFLFGSHYSFLGKWNTQIRFWITLGGLGIWAIVDLVTMKESLEWIAFKVFLIAMLAYGAMLFTIVIKS